MMYGSEKQIKWAEDIKAEAIETCERNIARWEKEPIFAQDAEILKIFRDFHKAKLAQIDDASKIIKMRNQLCSQSILQAVEVVKTQISRGKITLDEFARQMMVQ